MPYTGVGQSDGQTDIQTGRQIDGWTDRDREYDYSTPRVIKKKQLDTYFKISKMN